MKIMAIDDKIKDERIQSNINWKSSKISVLLSDKTDKHEYLTGEEILPSEESKMIEPVSFSSLFQVKLLKNKQKQSKI